MTDLEPGLVESMIELIRDLHADHIKHGAHDYVQDFVARTAAIVSVLPKPVDPDLIEAREICAQRGGFTSPIADGVRNGEYDETASITVVLGAIKRGRELQKAEASNASS